MIVIKTKLHDGIYLSQGGGTVVHYKWATGPRNLLKAIATLSEHRQSMRHAYGSIGCGGSWIEVDGVRLFSDELEEVDQIEFDRYTNRPLPPKRQANAVELLRKIATGELITDRAELAAWEEKCREQEFADLGDDL